MSGFRFIFFAAALYFWTIQLSLQAQADSATNIIIKLEDSPIDLHGSSVRDNAEPGIGLALSGGGSRGLAHIGVLKVFDREGVRIKFIVGVSMGAIIGGLYSSGYSPEEIEKIALEISWMRLFSPGPQRGNLLTTQKGLSEKSLIKIRFDKWRPVIPRAISSGQNLDQFLDALTARAGIRPSISFDYLDPPLRIICTDLSTGERVVLSSGNLSEAMRASMAFPIAFTPVDIGGRFLVDGGLIDPVPVELVAQSFGHPVVAINTSSDLLPAASVDNVIEIADQTTTIMSMRRKSLSLAMADLVITPDLANMVYSDFGDTRAIISLGERAAEKALPKLKELLAKRRDSADSTQCYPINDWGITGLSVMPMTFFEVGFSHSPEMSEHMIKSNLRSALLSGYLTDAYAEITPGDTGYFIEYHLTDNPRVKNVTINGATLFSEEDLLRLIAMRPGKVLNYKTLAADRKALEERYIKSGYSLVRVTTDFDESERNLIFNIDEGRINRIIIEGNGRTKGWAVRRHIPFKIGDIFEQERAGRGVADLYSTDLFETAKFLAVPDTMGVTLIVRVKEKPPYILRSGARFDLEYGSKAFFDLVDDNVFGAGQELYLNATAGEKKRSISLNFKADRIFKTLFTYNLTFDYNEFKQNHYDAHDYARFFHQFSHGGELSLGRQIPRLGSLWIIGQIRRHQWDEPGKMERQIFDKASVGFRSVVDTRDAIDFPVMGKYHLFEWEFAGDLSDDKVGYTRFYTSIESYYRLTERLNFHPRLSLGASSDFMPYFDEFSLGGQQNFMGLYEDEFLGDKLLLGEIEFRYRIFGPVYLHSRYNMGNIWNNLENIRLSELRYSGGFGIALKTPIGPVSTWYGRTAKGLEALYFSVGHDW